MFSEGEVNVDIVLLYVHAVNALERLGYRLALSEIVSEI